MRVAMSSGRSRGALLLEVIVAMTVLSTAGLMLLSWMQLNLETVTRLRQTDRESSLEANALALVERINPMREAAGEVALETGLVRWTATALQPPEPVAQVGLLLVGAGAGVESSFQVGLYKLTITAEPRSPAGPSQQFEIVRLGWQAAASRSVGTAPR